jgi:hypothetical protein
VAENEGDEQDCAAGAVVSASGYLLLFPFYATSITGMQIANVIHSVLRNVVLEPERGDQCDANYEWEAHEVVRILGASENALNASWPISGISSFLPYVMLRPVRPKTMKETAVSQCTNRSNALNRGILRPDRPAENADGSQQHIRRKERCERSDDPTFSSRAARRHLIIPAAQSCLDEHQLRCKSVRNKKLLRSGIGLAWATASVHECAWKRKLTTVKAVPVIAS